MRVLQALHQVYSRFWPIAELSGTEMITCFSSAIRLEAELNLPDPLTSEIDPQRNLGFSVNVVRSLLILT